MTISGSGAGAMADAVIVKKGAVIGVAVTNGGSGYTAPTVAITGNATGATASAYGGVEKVTIGSGGSGYTFPTVDLDLPNAPWGVQAKGHAEMDANGTIRSVVVDSPGSGYTTAPGVDVLNGTRFDPVPLNEGGSYATATSTLKVSDAYYDPSCDLNDPTTWQYQEDPFCEPPLIPGTPNISAGMEQFNDTPIVNGAAYPTTTVSPTAVRFRS